ncbi:MFS transporter [Streptomyces roseicoloratus]|uniref:MFS transporter n=1 Tax=Streptomyces roseicoloratus TaxID=2508722 RepID=UPI001009F120|nr:MFS transporter [Streptomyces roseicoloratus]
MTGRLRRRAALTCSVVGASVVALDGTVLTIAQPVLQRDLGADTAQVQWTSTGYLVAVASLLVFAGRLGDRYGHRRIFAVGCAGFALASAGIAAAPGIGWVVALRVLQGVTGALLQPATLGMLRAAYPPERLGMPVAVRTSAIGLAAAAGPLAGGALVDAYGWRAVFLIGIVPTLAVAVLCLAVPEPRRTAGPPGAGNPRSGRAAEQRAGARPAREETTRDRPAGAPSPSAPSPSAPSPSAPSPSAPSPSAPSPSALSPGVPSLRVPPVPPSASARSARAALRALDLPGAALLALALAALVQDLAHGPAAGSVPALAVAAVAVTAFVRHERRAPQPLLPPGMLRPGPVAAGLGALLAVSAALSGTLFTATYLLQDSLGLGPLPTALRMVPLALLMIVGAPLSAVLAKRVGARATATGGALLLSLGVLLLARPEVTGSGIATGSAAALIGAGFGAVMVTATSVVVHRAPEEHAGVAGGLQQTAMNTGPVLGVALASLLLASGSALPALAAVAALAVPATLALPPADRKHGKDPEDGPDGTGQDLRAGADVPTGPGRPYGSADTSVRRSDTPVGP